MSCPADELKAQGSHCKKTTDAVGARRMHSSTQQNRIQAENSNQIAIENRRKLKEARSHRHSNTSQNACTNRKANEGSRRIKYGSKQGRGERKTGCTQQGDLSAPLGAEGLVCVCVCFSTPQPFRVQVGRRAIHETIVPWPPELTDLDVRCQPEVLLCRPVGQSKKQKDPSHRWLLVTWN